MFRGGISLSVMLLLLLVNFVRRVRVGIDVYIPYRKYQVNPHSFSLFSAAYAAAIAHRNNFFHLY